VVTRTKIELYKFSTRQILYKPVSYIIECCYFIRVTSEPVSGLDELKQQLDSMLYKSTDFVSVLILACKC